ncbi:MAG TPA: hypothetical protein VFV87_20470, partial [Pirellulaceae bacterium]|nr:hypothetical protein [Pirellulaceae bacterium]
MLRAFLCSLLAVMAIAPLAQARGRRSGWSEESHQPKLELTEVQYTDHRDRKVDGSAGYNADLVTDLPQASEQKLYLTLTTAAQPTQRDLQVAEWFATDPRLVHFRTQTHWNWYDTANPHYRERL